MATTQALADALVPAAVRNWYLIPGDVSWNTIGWLFPDAAAALTSPAWANEALLVCALSAACWLVVLIVTLNVIRRLGLIALSILYRTGNRMRDLRTRLVCVAKRFAWRRQTSGTWHEEIELDELDISVLEHGAALAPGFAISVPDLCRRFGARPSVVERSLHKLCSYELVDTTLGSTDGYGNYTLTRSGAWFLSTCKRDATAPVRETAG